MCACIIEVPLTVIEVLIRKMTETHYDTFLLEEVIMVSLSLLSNRKANCFSFWIQLMHRDETGTEPRRHTASLFLVCQRHR